MNILDIPLDEMPEGATHYELSGIAGGVCLSVDWTKVEEDRVYFLSDFPEKRIWLQLSDDTTNLPYTYEKYVKYLGECGEGSVLHSIEEIVEARLKAGLPVPSKLTQLELELVLRDELESGELIIKGAL